MKTNASRILDKLGIKYDLREYEVDPEDLSAETVAQKIGLPLDQVWKTLVARGDRTGVLLAVLAGSSQLDLKGLAKVSGNRSVETVALKEVQPLTGYLRGGVTALAAKKDTRSSSTRPSSSSTWSRCRRGSAAPRSSSPPTTIYAP